jgi:AmmeMemoRadiSam system protein B
MRQKMVKKPYTLIVFVIITLTFFNAYGEDNMAPEHKLITRPASVAGAFYPESSEDLKTAVNGLLKDAEKKDAKGMILAAMAPHAGYVYSGQIAALTFKNISDIDFDTIVIIGHDTFQDAVAYTCPVDFFETPLGKIPVDREMMERLEAFNKGIRPDISIHRVTTL